MNPSHQVRGSSPLGRPTLRVDPHAPAHLRLAPEEFDAFVAMIEERPAPSAALCALMKRQPLWKRTD